MELSGSCYHVVSARGDGHQQHNCIVTLAFQVQPSLQFMQLLVLILPWSDEFAAARHKAAQRRWRRWPADPEVASHCRVHFVQQAEGAPMESQMQLSEAPPEEALAKSSSLGEAKPKLHPEGFLLRGHAQAVFFHHSVRLQSWLVGQPVTGLLAAAGSGLGHLRSRPRRTYVGLTGRGVATYIGTPRLRGVEKLAFFSRLTSGVLQGSPLSGMLLDFVMDRALERLVGAFSGGRQVVRGRCRRRGRFIERPPEMWRPQLDLSQCKSTGSSCQSHLAVPVASTSSVRALRVVVPARPCDMPRPTEGTASRSERAVERNTTGGSGDVSSGCVFCVYQHSHILHSVCCPENVSTCPCAYMVTCVCCDRCSAACCLLVLRAKTCPPRFAW